MSEPQLHFVPSGDQTIAVWEWPGSGPALLLSHATGFHGRCWDHIVRLFPGRRALALDFRGHGRSSKPAPPIPWLDFAHDVVTVARHFSVQGAVGVGHSMGGHSLVAAAIEEPSIFSALVLADPVIYPPEYYGATPPDASYIRRRRNRWQSADEMFERFRPRMPFAAWREDALRDYCDYALLPEDDSFILACPPEVEAAIYEQSNAAQSNLYAGIPKVKQPVVVLRAARALTSEKLDLSASPTAPDIASKFPHGRDICLPHVSHYIPQEEPELVAGQMAHF